MYNEIRNRSPTCTGKLLISEFNQFMFWTWYAIRKKKDGVWFTH